MSVKATLEVVNLAKVQRKLADGVGVREVVADVIRAAALSVQRNARAGAPRDTGALQRSLMADIKPTSARVYSGLSYAATMEEGRRPGAPPPPSQALAGWARRHGMAGREFVLARAIARRGIKGRFFMRSAIKKLDTDIRGFIGKGVVKIQREWGR